MGMGFITATKLIYRRKLLDVKVSTMLDTPTLRAQAKERKMVAGTAKLAERYHPHSRDATDPLKSAWDSVTEQTIARCRCMIPVANRICNTAVQLEYPPLLYCLRSLVVVVCLGYFLFLALFLADVTQR